MRKLKRKSAETFIFTNNFLIRKITGGYKENSQSFVVYIDIKYCKDKNAEVFAITRNFFVH